jgi:hypothetical protein
VIRFRLREICLRSEPCTNAMQQRPTPKPSPSLRPAQTEVNNTKEDLNPIFMRIRTSHAGIADVRLVVNVCGQSSLATLRQWRRLENNTRCPYLAKLRTEAGATLSDPFLNR